jgi:acyl-CoA thioesterase
MPCFADGEALASKSSLRFSRAANNHRQHPVNYSSLLHTARVDRDSVTLELTPDWLQGRTAFGGWQAALAVRAMRQVIGEDIPLRSLQANFIAPVLPGPVSARAELLRQGKSAAQLEARILIGDQVAFTALGIFGAARASAIIERPLAPACALAPNDLKDLPYIEGVVPVFTKHFKMRWASGGHPFSGAVNGDAQIYVRFCDEDLVSEAHLVNIADAIPPSAIAMLKTPVAISSMNWTLEFVTPLDDAMRNGWLRFDASLTASRDGYGWENVSIWSEAGELIALSRQCIAVFG